MFWPRFRSPFWLDFQKKCRFKKNGGFFKGACWFCPWLFGPKIVRKIQKSKMFTKILSVRAGKLSTTPFCTEFRCESNRADGISPNPLFCKVIFLCFPAYFLLFFTPRQARRLFFLFGVFTGVILRFQAFNMLVFQDFKISGRREFKISIIQELTREG